MKPIVTNKISDAVPIFKIRELREKQTGKVQGSVVGRVVRKPRNATNFLNIIIEDEEGQKIQCCIFGGLVEKYQSMLMEGAWYRFQDTNLQINNKDNKTLELKITNYSKVEKIKKQNR